MCRFSSDDPPRHAVIHRIPWRTPRGGVEKWLGMGNTWRSSSRGVRWGAARAGFSTPTLLGTSSRRTGRRPTQRREPFGRCMTDVPAREVPHAHALRGPRLRDRPRPRGRNFGRVRGRRSPARPSGRPSGPRGVPFPGPRGDEEHQPHRPDGSADRRRDRSHHRARQPDRDDAAAARCDPRRDRSSQGRRAQSSSVHLHARAGPAGSSSTSRTSKTSSRASSTRESATISDANKITDLTHTAAAIDVASSRCSSCARRPGATARHAADA